jgi:hypothetical protein
MLDEVSAERAGTIAERRMVSAERVPWGISCYSI